MNFPARPNGGSSCLVAFAVMIIFMIATFVTKNLDRYRKHFKWVDVTYKCKALTMKSSTDIEG